MAISGEDDPVGDALGMAYFPTLKRGENSQKTSDETDDYNCIGWALGDDDNWWCHLPDGKWPANVPREATIAALVRVFQGAGFTTCADGAPEAGYEKVALYAMGNGEWSHAARQRPDGHWTSKLGPYEDIRHDTPELVSGIEYGNVHCYMRRKHGQGTGNPAGPAEQPAAAEQHDAGRRDAGNLQDPAGAGEADSGQ